MKKYILPVIAILALFAYFKVSDPFYGVETDMGEELHEFGRSANGKATRIDLEGTNYFASAGPSLYQDENDEQWDYYTINVRYKGRGESYVFFERNYRIDDIPPELLLANVKDLVTYDPETKKVKFRIGDITETYVLPKE